MQSVQIRNISLGVSVFAVVCALWLLREWPYSTESYLIGITWLSLWYTSLIDTYRGKIRAFENFDEWNAVTWIYFWLVPIWLSWDGDRFPNLKSFFWTWQAIAAALSIFAMAFSFLATLLENQDRRIRKADKVE